mgnify:FL=1
MSLNEFMKFKYFLIAILVFLLLGAAYWIASPLFITKEVHEDLGVIMEMAASEGINGEKEELRAVKTGVFVGADNFHIARGGARVLKIGEKYFVRFEDDFSVTNGPDLFVYFGKDCRYSADARLGRLKGNIGSQNYEVPINLNPEDYNEIWVWCRAFSVPFGHAVLK